MLIYVKDKYGYDALAATAAEPAEASPAVDVWTAEDVLQFMDEQEQRHRAAYPASPAVVEETDASAN